MKIVIMKRKKYEEEKVGGQEQRELRKEMKNLRARDKKKKDHDFFIKQKTNISGVIIFKI